MAKNYSSSDSENDLFITQNTFTNDNCNLDISENDSFLFAAAQGLQNIGNVTLENILQKESNQDKSPYTNYFSHISDEKTLLLTCEKVEEEAKKENSGTFKTRFAPAVTDDEVLKKSFKRYFHLFFSFLRCIFFFYIMKAL